MDTEERMLVAETVVNKTGKRVPVFIHCGAMATKDTLKLAAHAYSIGADGIGVVTPSFFDIDDTAMINYYKTVAESLPDNFPPFISIISHNVVQMIFRRRFVKHWHKLAQISWE